MALKTITTERRATVKISSSVYSKFTEEEKNILPFMVNTNGLLEIRAFFKAARKEFAGKAYTLWHNFGVLCEGSGYHYSGMTGNFYKAENSTPTPKGA